jgi:hypothetical protein
MLCEADIGRVIGAVAVAAGCEAFPLEQQRFADARKQQIPLLRDIFGNPYRPATAAPAWLTSEVVALAQSIYDARAFDRLPELADALEQAGCTNAEMLNHCRQPGEHLRGCWVVDPGPGGSAASPAQLTCPARPVRLSFSKNKPNNFARPGTI